MFCYYILSLSQAPHNTNFQKEQEHQFYIHSDDSLVAFSKPKTLNLFPVTQEISPAAMFPGDSICGDPNLSLSRSDSAPRLPPKARFRPIHLVDRVRTWDWDFRKHISNGPVALILGKVAASLPLETAL